MGKMGDTKNTSGKGEARWRWEQYLKGVDWFARLCNLPAEGLIPQEISNNLVSPGMLQECFGKYREQGYRMNASKFIPYTDMKNLVQIVEGPHFVLHNRLSISLAKGIYADWVLHLKVNWAEYAHSKHKLQLERAWRRGQEAPSRPPLLRHAVRYEPPPLLNLKAKDGIRLVETPIGPKFPPAATADIDDAMRCSKNAVSADAARATDHSCRRCSKNPVAAKRTVTILSGFEPGCKLEPGNSDLAETPRTASPTTADAPDIRRSSTRVSLGAAQNTDHGRQCSKNPVPAKRKAAIFPTFEPGCKLEADTSNHVEILLTGSPCTGDADDTTGCSKETFSPSAAPDAEHSRLCPKNPVPAKRKATTPPCFEPGCKLQADNPDPAGTRRTGSPATADADDNRCSKKTVSPDASPDTDQRRQCSKNPVSAKQKASIPTSVEPGCELAMEHDTADPAETLRTASPARNPARTTHDQSLLSMLTPDKIKLELSRMIRLQKSVHDDIRTLKQVLDLVSRKERTEQACGNAQVPEDFSLTANSVDEREHRGNKARSVAT